MGAVVELRVFLKEDRMKVAAILFDNGYRVEQGKKPRLNADGKPGKSLDYYIIAEDIRGADAE